jgi:phosphodiesterase/alkaline phosphatase D-like protein
MEPLLIIGHTTPHATAIWVRGGVGHRSVQVTLRRMGGRDDESEHSRTLALRPSSDFTATARFTGLTADTPYHVTARFRRSPGLLRRWRRDRGIRDRYGTLRTFPTEDDDVPFGFLLGSCNLSVVSLTHLGGLAAAGVGMLAARAALARPRSHRVWDLWPLRAALARILPYGFGAIYWLTRFEQPTPALTSPFKALVEFQRTTRDRDGTPSPAAFAIHAGDQIYFDVPFPRRKPSVEEYRRAYREAWSEDPDLQIFFAQCPQYMAIDDHEIVDGFARDSLPDWLDLQETRTPDSYLEPAERVYREYVHERHPLPDGPLFYDFAYGASRFFVLDTRTMRYRRRGELIDQRQMRALKSWLETHRDALKFVVSSVPFLAELQPPPSDAKAIKDAHEPHYDKWCHDPYRRQRDEIVEHLYDRQIDRVVFLAGDMHCAYHASTRVGPPGTRITLHEIAGGPIHQLQFARRSQFHGHYRGTTIGLQVPFTTSMRRIHGAGGNVVRITVAPRSGEVRWEVIPTRAEIAPRNRGAAPDSGEGEPPEKTLAPMSGVILWDGMRCRRPVANTVPS